MTLCLQSAHIIWNELNLKRYHLWTQWAESSFLYFDREDKSQGLANRFIKWSWRPHLCHKRKKKNVHTMTHFSAVRIIGSNQGCMHRSIGIKAPHAFMKAWANYLPHSPPNTSMHCMTFINSTDLQQKGHDPGSLWAALYSFPFHLWA